ncbi:RNA-directed DNA polymerase, eukaryota, partial [Tanacetum coccineum]
MNFMSLNIQGLGQRAKKDWIKELCTKNKVNFVSLQETKMETIELFNVKECWGNFAFEYKCGASVGNSGGILCIWDPSMFRNTMSTASDYFIMVKGEWVPSGKKLLIISIYAPQELKEKKMLWDYLIMVINNWNGEVVIMGDFNEVRMQTERFGSKFNVHGADIFNSFIATAGLEEVPLGGCSFTWCHKSATKMSKLDRFLISEGLAGSCPNISAVALDRYLSDHRPILLHKRDSSSKNQKKDLIKELAEIDLIIDKGEGNAEVLIKRMDVINSLHDIKKSESMEMAQKAKIKWAIEGDENSKYFHGILNKRRNQLSIRGIFAEGIWIDSPKLVKNEFLTYFSNRFDQPSPSRLVLDSNFHCKLDNCSNWLDLGSNRD